MKTKIVHRGGGTPSLLLLRDSANAEGKNFGMKTRFCNIVIQAKTSDDMLVSHYTMVAGKQFK